MIVKKFAFGNSKEAFIEKRLTNKVNIIFSDDNNKGKTLVVQGIMYAIGNEAIFPSGFDYRSYYFYVKIDFEGIEVEFLRRNNILTVKSVNDFQVCSTISEFKYTLSKYIGGLPQITKNDQLRLVDPCLFFELFFIGQDKIDPSNIFSKGFYTKLDFINMIFAIEGISSTTLDAYDLNLLKDELLNKSTKLKKINQEIARLKITPEIKTFTLSSADSIELKKKEKSLYELRTNISKLDRSRSREINRKHKLQSLLIELRSLNRNIEIGGVICSECGSEEIIYKNGDINFEISNKYMRKSIIESIKNSILLKEEIIEELTRDISKYKNRISIEITTTKPDVRDLLLFKDEIQQATGINSDADKLIQEISQLKEKLQSNSTASGEEKEQQKNVLQSIVEKINLHYKWLNPSGRLTVDKLFTVKSETYSGSEEQEFYFCKLLAIKDYLNHSFPIIIDAFRRGEISTDKEDLMLKAFEELKNQVIITSTLKTEEYDNHKYYKSPTINPIDYSEHKDSKILSTRYLTEFISLLSEFNVKIETEI